MRPLESTAMYPAGVPGIAVRRVTVLPGLGLRVLEAGPANGAPVLLLHGWGASAYSYRAALPALAAAGLRAVAVDLPGHGLSDAPAAPAGYTRNAMVAAVAALMNTLDLRNATVVGVSMGGAIATGLALQEHLSLKRVALINPVGLGAVRLVWLARLLAPPALQRRADRMISPRVVRWALRRAYFDSTRVTERDVAEYWAALARPGAAGRLVDFLHHFAWQPFSPVELHSIQCRVLLVVGAHDRLVVRSEAPARALRTLQVAHIEGGHAVNEECPQEVNALLVKFAAE